MAKFSIYVPDELWERAMKRAGKTKNPSQLVQEAVQRFVTEREARTAALAATAALDSSRVEQTVVKLRAAAQAEFRRGYVAGLELVESLGFGYLQTMVGLQLDVVEVAENWLGDDDEWAKRYEEEVYHGKDEHPVFLDGANRAVTDVWEALRGDGWGLAAPDEDQESAEVGAEANSTSPAPED